MLDLYSLVFAVPYLINPADAGPLSVNTYAWLAGPDLYPLFNLPPFLIGSGYVLYASCNLIGAFWF